MLGRLICERFQITPQEGIFLLDDERINEKMEYDREPEDGHWFYSYKSAHEYRRECREGHLTDMEGAIVIATSDMFVPYDLLTQLRVVKINWRILFPNLNEEVLRSRSRHEINLLSAIHDRLVGTFLSKEETNRLFETEVKDETNLKAYFAHVVQEAIYELQCCSFRESRLEVQSRLEADLVEAQRFGYTADASAFYKELEYLDEKSRW